MKTIYVDDMFALNLIINYFIMLATAKVCALPLKRGRFALSAALGAIYSVLTLLPELGFLVELPMKLCLGLMMVLISFGSAKRILKPFIAFLCISAAFGGAVLAAALLSGSPLSNGLYINASMKTLVISFAVSYAALTLVFKQLGRRRSRRLLDVEIGFDGKTASLKALHDTGNELYDPISGLPVLVVEASVLSAFFPSSALGALSLGSLEFMTSISDEGALKTRFRLVPYMTTGVSHGLIPVFRPDYIKIGSRETSEALVGLSGNKLSPDGEFSAIY